MQQVKSPVQSRQVDQKAIVLADGSVQSLGDVFFASGLFQDIKSSAQAIVKVMKGKELGIPPLEAMSSINVIRGRISLSASAMAAVIKRSGKYRFTVVEHTDEHCEIEFYERMDGKWEISGRSAFTSDDARRAEVFNGDNWRKYPRNMLYARALSNGARWYCPDVVSGIYTPDELGALEDEDGNVVQQAKGQCPDRQVVEPSQSQSPAKGNGGKEGGDRRQANGNGKEMNGEGRIGTRDSEAYSNGSEDAGLAAAPVDRADRDHRRTSNGNGKCERSQWLFASAKLLAPSLMVEEREHLRRLWLNEDCSDENLYRELTLIAREHGVSLSQERA